VVEIDRRTVPTPTSANEDSVVGPATARCAVGADVCLAATKAPTAVSQQLLDLVVDESDHLTRVVHKSLTRSRIHTEHRKVEVLDDNVTSRTTPELVTRRHLALRATVVRQRRRR